MRRASLLHLLLLLALVRPCAALEWKTDNITVATAPFQKTQDVVFEFRNNGPKPVTFLDLQTNCDCLDATASGKTFLPGATGTIKATFTTGERAGRYERLITLVTDESPTPVQLLARFDVPEIAVVTPRSVTWHIGDPAAEKTVEFTSAAGLEINFTEAQPTNDAFTARLETVEAGRHYRLHLTPRSTALSASAAIRVFGREKTGHDVVVSAYANIQ